MDIKTDTPLVKKAREGVMEFLLVKFHHRIHMMHLCFTCCALERDAQDVHHIAHMVRGETYMDVCQVNTVLCADQPSSGLSNL